MLDSLEHDDSDGIVEDALAKDDRVQLRVDVEGVEDGEDGDGVGCGEGGAEEEALDDGQREPFEAEEGVAIDDDPVGVRASERVGRMVKGERATSDFGLHQQAFREQRTRGRRRR